MGTLIAAIVLLVLSIPCIYFGWKYLKDNFSSSDKSTHSSVIPIVVGGILFVVGIILLGVYLL